MVSYRTSFPIYTLSEDKKKLKYLYDDCFLIVVLILLYSLSFFFLKFFTSLFLFEIYFHVLDTKTLSFFLRSFHLSENHWYSFGYLICSLQSKVIHMQSISIHVSAKRNSIKPTMKILISIPMTTYRDKFH